jgi:hypothetical protein
MAQVIEAQPVATAILRAAPYARISREDEGNVDNTDIQIDEDQDFTELRGSW